MEMLFEVRKVGGGEDPSGSPFPSGSEDEGEGSSGKRMKLMSTGIPNRVGPFPYPPLVSVSVRNMVAFSSYIDLTVKKEGIAGCHLYVADLNTPWEVYLVKNSTSPVTLLSWDSQNTNRLLVGFECGVVQVFTMSMDHLMNRWVPVVEASFPGEPLVAASFLGAPRRVTVSSKDGILYSEKYSVTMPHCKGGFGGKALDGFVLVTGTGLVGAVIQNHPGEEGSKQVVASEKFQAIRGRVVYADMTWNKDGEIVVVTSSDNPKQPVLLHKLSVTLTCLRDKAEIKSASSQSLFLTTNEESGNSSPSISSVQFVRKGDADQLLISLWNKDKGTSSVLLYELVQESVQLKARFQSQNGDGAQSLTTYKWQQIAQTQFNSEVTSVSCLAFPLAQQTQNANNNLAVLNPLIATALLDGTVVLSRCDNLQQVGAPFPLSSTKVSDSENQSNKPTVPSSNLSLLTMAFSWSGCVLVGLNRQNSLVSFKVHPNLDASTATLLLELGMMGGLDPWDVLMCIKPGAVIDSISEKLGEGFVKQPPAVQSHYNSRILVLKTALHRLGPNGAAKINDQQTLLVLNLVAGALKALLRPSELSSKDKGPSESLSSLLSSSGEQYSDLTKVLVQMAATEYAVEAVTLQSIQPFLQWCANLVLKLLASLPDLRNSRTPGWEVYRDSKAISTLRELIVLMRIWGLQRPSCLPAFRKNSENVDVLPLLFRLLAKLSAAPHEQLDETLIDECCLLPSEVQIPNHTAYCPTKSLGLSSHILFSKAANTAFQFHYGEIPLKWWVGVETSGNWMDGLRLFWLGKNPTGVKICNRCGLTTLLSLPPRSTANKAWDLRFVRNCPCGGNWKIPSFLPQPNKFAHQEDFLNHL